METSAEKILKENALRMRALRRGSSTERLPDFGPLTWDGPLDPSHPLFESVEDRRRLARRMRQEARGHR